MLDYLLAYRFYNIAGNLLWHECHRLAGRIFGRTWRFCCFCCCCACAADAIQIIPMISEKPKHGPPPYNDNAQQYVAIRFATMGMSACGP